MKKKKRPFNLAIVLMLITTLGLSIVQFGFSFFGQNFLFSGTGTINTGGANQGEQMIIDANSAFAVSDASGDPTTGGNIAEEAGYTTFFRASKDEPLNNYLKFSENANELWRIIGFTDQGIKIIRENQLISESGVVWDSSNRHWVDLDAGAPFSHTQTVTSLDQVSVMCNYLNTTYYNSLTDIANINYVDPIYINCTSTWDITPMINTNRIPSFASTASFGSIKYTSQVSDSFVGLPIGLISVAEMSLVSSDYNNNAVNLFTTVFTGWLAGNTTTYEMTLTDVCPNNISSTQYSSSAAFFARNNQFNNSGKTSAQRAYRPVMYLNSSILFTVANNDTAKGSETNPFIVTGIKR